MNAPVIRHRAANSRVVRSMLMAALAVSVVAMSFAAAQPRHAPSARATEPVRWTPAAVSTPGYESSPAFTPDGREMYYVTADRAFRNYRIFISTCRDGAWSRGEAVSFAAPGPVIEADPFVTADGRRLYYVSARDDPRNEDFDIWHVDRQTDGSWGAPQRLPAPVNSEGSELLPRLDGAGRLYFGSDRAGGHGQSDIYVATQNAAGQWRVDNVGPPVSTAANEYEAAVSRDGAGLIVVADRGDRSHLYRYARLNGAWAEQGRLPGRNDVFQVGPLLSPDAGRLLFAQADGDRSGEMFVVTLAGGAHERWPPNCRR